MLFVLWQRDEWATGCAYHRPIPGHAARRSSPATEVGGGLYPHTLRHTFAKNLGDTEVSLDRVAALPGPENLNTTRIYTTPSVHDLTEAVERLEGE